MVSAWAASSVAVMVSLPSEPSRMAVSPGAGGEARWETSAMIWSMVMRPRMGQRWPWMRTQAPLPDAWRG